MKHEKKITIKITRLNTKPNKRYFLEKTSNLLYDLLIGVGDAKSRLRENEIEILYILHLDIPELLKAKQKELLTTLSKKKVSRVGGHTLTSSFQNTLSSMRNSTASKIIQKISSLYHEVKILDEP